MLQFLTRITIIRDLPFDEEFHKGIVYFPLVGLVQGLILAVVYAASGYLTSSAIAAIFTIAAYLCITGALHLDGLGDTFDGFYSSRPKEGILTIMKDSRLGTNGMAVLFFALFIKITGIQAMPSSALSLKLIILMPVFGKLSLVLGAYKASYARKEGLGNIFIGRVQPSEVVTATITAAIISLIDVKSLFFLPFVFIIALLFKEHSNNKIDGMTGDTLGALAEIAEICYIFYLIILLKWT